MLRLGHIELFVRDPLASRAFYEGVLGFEVTAVQGDRFVWLRSGETEILLRPGVPPACAEQYGGAQTGLVLYADDMPAAVARLRECGVEFREADGSDECVTFADVDGHWFQLVDPGDH